MELYEIKMEQGHYHLYAKEIIEYNCTQNLPRSIVNADADVVANDADGLAMIADYAYDRSHWLKILTQMLHRLLLLYSLLMPSVVVLLLTRQELWHDQ